MQVEVGSLALRMSADKIEKRPEENVLKFVTQIFKFWGAQARLFNLSFFLNNEKCTITFKDHLKCQTEMLHSSWLDIKTFNCKCV